MMLTSTNSTTRIAELEMFLITTASVKTDTDSLASNANLDSHKDLKDGAEQLNHNLLI
jgi:hypothetical protein